MEQISKILNNLISKWNNQIKDITQRTGIKGTYVLIALSIALIFVYCNILENLITNLVGTIYPAFWTMKSIENNNNDRELWLCYWIVFVSFTMVDLLSPFIVKVFRFYFLFKIIFLIWLFMPNSKGCTYVYHLIIKQIFQSYENDLDKAAGKVKEYTKDYIFTKDNKKTVKKIKTGIQDTKEIFKPIIEEKFKEITK